MRHPLKNNNSKHYDNNGKSAINELEKKLSVSAMMGFVEGNCFKYEFRKDHKGQKASDEEKIKTYKAYGDVLKYLLHKGHKGLTVSHALELEGIVYEA